MANPHNITTTASRMLTGALIDASARFAARRTASVDAAVSRAAERLAATAERRICAAYEPHVKALPFVSMPEGEPELTTTAPLSYWAAPDATYQQGRAFARLAVSAVLADADTAKDGTPCARRLEQILEGIVADAVARRIKGGKGSRRILPPAADGFVSELAAIVAAAGAVALDDAAV